MAVSIASNIDGDRHFATGFFVKIDGDNFLVSNKHVFKTEDGGFCDNIIIKFLPDRTSTGAETRRINLQEGNCLIHPEDHGSSGSIDVAVLPLNFNPSQSGNIVFPEEGLISRGVNSILSPYSNMIVGYPGEEAKFNSDNTPIVKQGLTSTPFGPSFNDDPYFLIDTKLYDGMSGSPVFPSLDFLTRNTDTAKLTFKYEGFIVPGVLGIHSGPVDQRYDYRLHRVWYTDTIREIVDQYTS